MTSLAFAAASVEPFLHQNVADWWPHHIDQSAWLEHTPFAAWLIPRFKPNLMVELGTHRAVSYMAFCQANAKLDVPGKYFAVDTWEGDEHAGIYSEAIFHGVEKLNDQYREFSTLLRCSFVEASSHFQEASIDLLHIDGLHTYEAVSEDFYTWLPKMSDRGIILFHDIEVKERNFGVWKLWNEVIQKFPHFAFSHGHGLGILAVGHKIPETLKELFDAGKSLEQVQYWRENFHALGARVSKNYNARLRAGLSRTISNTTRSTSRRPGLSRSELLLAGAQIEWKILEIGPSHRPVAAKKSGWQTTIIDHASKEELTEKYKNDQFLDTSQIEEVDFIWKGENLKTSFRMTS
jgi:Methyltransferase domain